MRPLVKTFIAAALLSGALLAAFLNPKSMTQGEIHVDDDHMQIGDNAKSKLTYVVAPSDAVWLDFTRYRFTLWPKEEPAPDYISVYVGEHQYYIPLEDGKTRYLISRETATAREGGHLFPGLVLGSQVMIAIGRRQYDSAKREDILRVHWLGMVEVK